MTDDTVTGRGLRTNSDATKLLARFLGDLFDLFDELEVHPGQALGMLGFAAGFITEDQRVEKHVHDDGVQAGKDWAIEFRGKVDEGLSQLMKDHEEN